MLKQTVKPDRVLLWLSDLQFPDRILPSWADAFAKSGVEFCFCADDLKPHKKYYYSIKENPDSIIITCDDDLWYSDTFVEVLYKSYLRYPYAIHTYAGHKITFNRLGETNEEYVWKFLCDEDVGIPSMRLVMFTGLGTLIPPKSLNSEVFNKDAKWLSP
jgi:hypothetical protein